MNTKTRGPEKTSFLSKGPKNMLGFTVMYFVIYNGYGQALRSRVVPGTKKSPGDVPGLWLAKVIQKAG
jgi:hypothetical protein